MAGGLHRQRGMCFDLDSDSLSSAESFDALHPNLALLQSGVQSPMSLSLRSFSCVSSLSLVMMANSRPPSTLS
jgi:hypothetical protein